MKATLNHNGTPASLLLIPLATVPGNPLEEYMTNCGIDDDEEGEIGGP